MWYIVVENQQKMSHLNFEVENNICNILNFRTKNGEIIMLILERALFWAHAFMSARSFKRALSWVHAF